MDLESRYELIEKIGSGSFATVYRARDNELGREVAIKQIHEQYLNDPAQLSRYWQEAQLLASLHHPNIVTIFDIYRDRGWLIMELMQANLSERMEGRQMDLRALRATLAHALRALKYLHSRGIIHGDIKTSNLMIDSRKRVKLGDFGLARRASDDEGSLLKGTTKYMAPEVVDERFGDVGPASDLYSLGFAAYELMCGPNFEDLFPGLSAFGRNKQIAWMMWHAAPDRRLPEIPRVLQGVPEDLVKVIQKLCEKDQKKRYKTADEALADLDLGEKGTPSSGAPVADVPLEVSEEKTPDKKRMILLGTAVGVSLLLSLFMLFAPNGGGDTQGPEEIANVGFVREIDPGKNLIVWTDPEKGIPKDLKIEGEPEIYLNNEKKYIQLREIEEGDRIEWEVEGSGSRAKFKIYVSRPILNRGTVRDIDPRKSTVIVTIEDGAVREDLVLRVPERAKIQVNGKDVRLGDLRQGDRVEIKHLDEIGRKSGRVIEYIEAKRTEKKVGFVTDYDQGRDMLTIRHGYGIKAQLVKLPMAKDCKIVLKPFGGAGLEIDPDKIQFQKNDRIQYEYDTEILSITVVPAKEKLLGGQIEEVRTAQQEILVIDPNNKQWTFKIPAAGEVTVNHSSASMRDLRRFDTVSILYDEVSPGGATTAMTVDAYRPIRADRTAILVSVQAYRNESISTLPYAGYNVAALRETLIRRYAFDPQRIVLIQDESAEEMQDQLKEEIANVGSDIQLIVYVCCQGYETSSNSVFLAGVDCDPDEPETGMSLKWLVSELDDCSSKNKMLLLDCSHAGNGRDLERQPSTSAMLATVRDRMDTLFAIASCDTGQQGHTLDEEKLSLFAYALCQGFSGDADPNQDLQITARDLWSTVSREMSARPLPNGTVQRPVLISP